MRHVSVYIINFFFSISLSLSLALCTVLTRFYRNRSDCARTKVRSTIIFSSWTTVLLPRTTPPRPGSISAVQFSEHTLGAEANATHATQATAISRLSVLSISIEKKKNAGREMRLRQKPTLVAPKTTTRDVRAARLSRFFAIKRGGPDS